MWCTFLFGGLLCCQLSKAQSLSQTMDWSTIRVFHWKKTHLRGKSAETHSEVCSVKAASLSLSLFIIIQSHNWVATRIQLSTVEKQSKASPPHPLRFQIHAAVGHELLKANAPASKDTQRADRTSEIWTQQATASKHISMQTLKNSTSTPLKLIFAVHWGAADEHILYIYI